MRQPELLHDAVDKGIDQHIQIARFRQDLKAASGDRQKVDGWAGLARRVTGTEAQVQIPKMRTCGTCAGSGARAGTKPESCTRCRGSGQVVLQQGFFRISRPCDACGGAGEIVRERCADCRGAGRVEGMQSIKVKVPAGVDEVMIGPAEPLPVSSDILEALTSVEVTATSDQASGFQLTFTLSHNSPLHTIFMLSGGTPIPLVRVVIIATMNGTPEVLMDGVMTNHQVVPGSDRVIRSW